MVRQSKLGQGTQQLYLSLSEEMVGHKLGEFSPTRKFSGHTPADKKAAAEGGAPSAAAKSAPSASSTASSKAPAAKPSSAPKGKDDAKK